MGTIYYQGIQYSGTGAGTNSYGGTTPPSSDLGNNGDYYYLLNENNKVAIIYVKLNNEWIEIEGGDVIIQEGEKYYAEYGQFKIAGDGNLGMEGVVND